MGLQKVEVSALEEAAISPSNDVDTRSTNALKCQGQDQGKAAVDGCDNREMR